MSEIVFASQEGLRIMRFNFMEFNYNDGGRAEAGYKGTAGDCVVRAIAIATEIPYQAIYELVNDFGKTEKKSKRKSSKSSARTGVYKPTIRRIMKRLGWEWTPTMFIGSGCKVHLRTEELPKGRLVVAVSKHSVAVIDGVINDLYECSRNGTRCVYGYYSKT